MAMESFVRRALQQIRDRSSRSDRELRSAIDEVFAEFDKASGHPGKADAGNDDTGAADRYWLPFKLACAHRKQEIRHAALDCIEKLIAHGFLRGNAPIPGANGEKSKALLIDDIVHSICECKENATAAVELQIIKALLTVVSSSTCKVHGMSLVYAVRACYQIYLVTKDAVNKITAKGCLTQMLHVVFQAMEDYDKNRRLDLERTGRRSWADGHPDESVLRVLVDKKMSAAPDTPLKACFTDREFTWLESHRDAAHFKKMLQVMRPRKPKAEVATKGGAQAAEISGQTARHSSEQNLQPILPSVYPAVAASLGLDSLIVSNPIQASDSTGSSKSSRSSAKKTPRKSRRQPGSVKHRSIHHQDAFLLFRALCNLSVKSHTDDGTGLVNPYGLQSKLLSLELILSILRQSLFSFRINVTLINGVRDHLCAALLENCLSSESSIVELSLRLFMVLVESFKDYLVVEIEAFICEIFLRVLESPTAAFVQKRLVLEAFRKLCQDRNTLVEIFLNYDVTLDASGLPKLHGVYELIVEALQKVVLASGKKRKKVKGSGSDAKHAAQERQESMQLAVLGLQSLSAILDSLSEFLPAASAKNENDKLFAAADVDLPHGSDAGGGAASETDNTSSPKILGEQDDKSVGKRFDTQQQLKAHLKAAFAQFNKKPRTGIEFLQEKGIIGKGENASKSIAQWLAAYPDDLDKTLVGDYLGDERYVDVMHAYVELMDFTGLGVDEGIRLFLAGFRLPGEAQKIDRMMEAFAARFCGNNPGSFENCDACFVLSYSIIMLNTDLHNDNIPDEKKISFEQFVNMTRGINNGKDFARDFLNGIYTRIKTDAISLREDDEARAAAAVRKVTEKHHHAGRAQAHALQQMDVDVKVKAAKATMLKNQRKYVTGTLNYTKADAATEEHVRPMFEVSCRPMLAVFGTMLENYSDPEIVESCVRGIRRAVHIAGLYVMEEPLQKFVGILCKFCNFGPKASFQKKVAKHIECIKAVVAIALEEGNYLHSSWAVVLGAISQLARLQAFVEGDYSAEATLLEAPIREKHGGDVKARSPTATEKEQRHQDMLAVAKHVSASIDSRSIDRIFMRSPQLDEHAIKHFVLSLASASRSELDTGTTKIRPRKFSMQKVVEVADYNMSCRGRFVWSQIWAILSEHFTFCGCHSDLDVAMYAIDSLKQLSMKFLSKEEIRGFKFQKAFLKPFETIIKQSRDTRIRELILCVVQNMVLGRVDNIRSGWKNILVVLGTAAGDSSVPLVELGFSVAESLVKEHFAKIRGDFVDLVSCLLAFARGTSLKVSLAAMDLLRRCAVHLALGHVPLQPEAHSPELDVSLSAAMSERDFERILDAAGVATPNIQTAVPEGVNDGDSQVGGSADVSSDGNSDDERGAVTPDKERQTPPARRARKNVGLNTAVKSVEAELESSDGHSVVAASVVDYSSDEEEVAVWWPLLMGLVDLVVDPRLPVRLRAVETLRSSFYVAGPGFSPDLWELVFKAILFPLFDDTTHGGRETLHPPSLEDEWLQTTGLVAFGAVVELFGKFFVAPTVGGNELRFLLPDFLALLERCIHFCRGHAFAEVAISCQRSLLTSCGHLFSVSEWDLVVESLRRCLQTSTPVALLPSQEWVWPNAAGEAAIEHEEQQYRRVPVRLSWQQQQQQGGTVHTGRLDAFFNEADAETREHEGSGDTNSDLPDRLVWVQCRIHLDLLAAISQIVDLNLLAGPGADAIAAAADGLESDVLRRHRLNATQIASLVDALECSYDMAVAFNENANHREDLAAAGFAGGNVAPAHHQALKKTKVVIGTPDLRPTTRSSSRKDSSAHGIANLILQETSAARKLLTVLLPLIIDDRLNADGEGFAALAYARLPALAIKVVRRYVQLDVFVMDHRCEDQPDRFEEGRMRNQLTPIVVGIVTGVAGIEEAEFRGHQLPWLYPLLVELMPCSNRDLRLIIADVFWDEKIRGLVLPSS